MDKSHSTCPGPLLFIAHVVASRSLSRLLRALARRHRIEAAWLDLPLRPLAALDQVEEPGGTSGQARSGGGLGQREMALKGVRQALILKPASASRSKRRRSRVPINDLLEYWIDISRRRTLTLEDFALFFERAQDSIEYFAEFYGWTRLKHIETSPDKFLTRVHSMAWWKDKFLKAAKEHNRLSNNDYAFMKNTAKKFIPRIRTCFGQDIIAAIDGKTPLQDGVAILDLSSKLTYRWAAGIVVSNHIATVLIQLSRFRNGDKYSDDIKTLYDNLKNRTTNRKLRAFLVKSFRRFEDADKLRNRCAHVLEGEPTKQEIQQSIALARLLQKHGAPYARTRRIRD